MNKELKDLNKVETGKETNQMQKTKDSYTTNSDDILSDEEKSLIESVLNIVINHHNPNDHEQVLLSIQKTIENKKKKGVNNDGYTC